MRTIVNRRRKDGALGYTAQTRIHRDGKRVHSEPETLNATPKPDLDKIYERLKAAEARATGAESR